MNRIIHWLSQSCLGLTTIAICLQPLATASAQQSGAESSPQVGAESARESGAEEDLTLGVRVGPSPTTGVLIREVLPGSPADQAGVRSGDYILSVDETRIASREELNREIAEQKPGTTARMEIWRNRQRQTVTVPFPKSGNPGHGSSERWHQYRRPSSRYPDTYSPGYRSGPALTYPARRPYYAPYRDPYGPRYYGPYGPRSNYDPYGRRYYDGYPRYGRPGYGVQLGRFRLDYWD